MMFKPRLFLLSVLLGLTIQSTMSSTVVPIISVVNQDVAILGETPFWDPTDKVLYYVDVLGGFYCRLNPATGEIKKVSKGSGVQLFMPYRNEPGQFLVSQANKMFKLNFDTEEWTQIAEIPEGENFNDAKCDKRGRLFVGTFVPDQQDKASLYRLDGNQLTKLASPFTTANGMVFSNDDNSTKFFLNDSAGRKIYHFDYDIETGALTNKQVLVDTLTSIDFQDVEEPDGMVIDEFGFLWIALWNGGRIAKIDAETGRVTDQVILPNNNVPASLARGEYEGRDGYYITTATYGVPEELLKPDDGKVLHVSFQGAQVNTFVP